MILLDAGTVEMFVHHREGPAELQRLLGAGYHDDGWVFCPADGTTFHPERFGRQFIRKQDAYNTAHPDKPLRRLSSTAFAPILSCRRGKWTIYHTRSLGGVDRRSVTT
jgi:hypothetical protein